MKTGAWLMATTSWVAINKLLPPMPGIDVQRALVRSARALGVFA